MPSSDVIIVLQFAFAVLLPVIASVILTQVLDRTSWGQKIGYWPKQILIGLIFGAIAIYGTEFGIKTHDASMNVRDAAPLVAGLYFGGPAGIIAGIIGGVERWFAAYWGRGAFTQVACSTATIFAGFYAALLRKFLFDNRRPSWLIAFAIGMVAEVLHMLLVFLTNLDDAVHAFLVAQACTIPMVSCVAISVALSGAVLALMSGQTLRKKSDTPDISQKVQMGMLIVVAVGFVATVGFVAVLQTNLSAVDADGTLTTSLGDIRKDIENASDANLLSLANRAAQEIPSVTSANQETVDRVKESMDLAEVHVVNDIGVIVESSENALIGFNMGSGEQAAEFLSLLPGGEKTQLAQSYQPMTADSSVWRKYAGVRIEGGFIQVGYDAARFIGNLTDSIRVAVANRHVGKEGMMVVMTARSELVGTRSDVKLGYQDVQHLASDMTAKGEKEMFLTSVGDVSYIAMYQYAEGLKIVALLPTSEAQIAHDLSIMITSFMEVLVFAALFMAIYVLIERVVVRSIWRVNGRLGEITKGDLNVKVDVHNSSEFKLLSDDINETVAALRRAIEAESARIERDLATAKAIQESALPRTFPPFPDISAFDIYASMNAAREVGGDFYDFFLIDKHTLGFLIADVSGKGIPASLFMMAAKSELANYMKSGMELSEAVQSANFNLCQGNDAGMFVTVWAAALDFETGQLTYVNAGHNPPLLRHDGKWEWLKQKGGLFLGTFETARYRSHSLVLRPHDELLLYTDGVNEAFSAEEEEYGNDRLEAFLSKHPNLHPHMLIDMLRAELRRWSKGAEQSDDITMLSVEFGQPPEVSSTIRVPASVEGLEELMRRVHYDFWQLQCPESVQSSLDLAIEELVTNVYQHGYEDGKPDGEVELSYVYDTHPCSLTISITDWGEPFDPTHYDGANDDEGDEVTGMGIAIALANVDDAAYVRDGDRNVVAFRKEW